MSSANPRWWDLDLARWASASELAEHMRSIERPVIELGDVEYVDAWATTTVDGLVVAFGLDRAGQHPQAAETGEDHCVVIGFNDRLVGIDLAQRRPVSEIRFGSPFYEFVDVTSAAVVALFETGALSVAADGTERWRVDTDLISDWVKRDRELVVTSFEGRSRTLDLHTGRSQP